MKLAIMQPYFLPYIGYFQLIGAVDEFIVYDNIKYTKRGWINRNRMLLNGKDAMFSLPLKKDSDFLNVCQRELAADFNREKLLNQLEGAYRGAPQFGMVFPLIQEVVRCNESNLFLFIHNSILKISDFLQLGIRIRISSEIAIDHRLTGRDKVLALCKAVGADIYINAIGGTELYSKDDFAAQGIALQFIKSKPFEYRQFVSEFVPWLSIVDVLMFNTREDVRSAVLSNYDLL